MYEGSYIVQEGDIALREPIKVIYTEPDGASYTRLSQRPVTIRTRASYLPRITSPRQGSQIGSPVVVTGFATPGSRVRVVIEFRRVVEGVLPIQGVTAIHDVVADSTGRWQTPPLAAVAPFSDTEPQLRSDWGIFSDIYTWRDRERPTVYTITAVSIGAAGEERAAYSIDVTKQEGYTVGGVTTDPVEQNAGSRG
jgi:hypothetical protein